ncbi:MAG: hypothetical protein P4L31_01515 [Candidatus Babeliales bacterium]|nr:hypothetical protein [Candidatus Babeliales bacterium]
MMKYTALLMSMVTSAGLCASEPALVKRATTVQQIKLAQAQQALSQRLIAKGRKTSGVMWQNAAQKVLAAARLEGHLVQGSCSLVKDSIALIDAAPDWCQKERVWFEQLHNPGSATLLIALDNRLLHIQCMYRSIEENGKIIEKNVHTFRPHETEVRVQRIKHNEHLAQLAIQEQCTSTCSVCTKTIQVLTFGRASGEGDYTRYMSNKYQNNRGVQPGLMYKDFENV